MKSISVALLAISIGVWCSSVDGQTGSTMWTPDSAEVDAISKTQMALYDIERAVGQMSTPVSVREAIQVIGAAKLRWSGHIGPAQQGGRTIRDAEQIYSVIVPELKDMGYVVVFRGENLYSKDGVVKEALVGFQTPAGRIYFADLWYVKKDQTEEKSGEPGATDNPGDAQ